MTRQKTQVSEYPDFQPSQYSQMHNVILGATATGPIHNHNESIPHSSVQGLLPAIQLYNGYRTFKTKDQWENELGLKDLRH